MKIHRLGDEGHALCGYKLDDYSVTEYSLEDNEITCDDCKELYHQGEVDRLRRMFAFLDLTEEKWEEFYNAWVEELQIAEDILEMRGISQDTLDSAIIMQDAGMKALKRVGVLVKKCPTCGSPMIEFEFGGGGGGQKKTITPEAGH